MENQPIPQPTARIATKTAITYPVAAEAIPTAVLSEGRYEVRFATTIEELDEVLRLRFEIFNVELGEGLDESWQTRRDRDPFDAVCHHLIVTEKTSGEIVGTYRMQTTEMAERHHGLYSAQEFALESVDPHLMSGAVEVGRACVAEPHRNTQVLFLLWKGLALYMAHNQLRFLFGCCSLTSQDPAEGLAMLEHLREKGHFHESVWIEPKPELACEGPSPSENPWDGQIKVPKLFRIYLRHGAKVCGPPAIDREFKTIDFLVLFDVAAMDEKRMRTFFG